MLVAASLDDWKKITLSVWSSGSAFCRNSELREDHAEVDKNLLNR